MGVMRSADRQGMDDCLRFDPANAEMLLRSVAGLNAGKGVEREVVDP
jgi:hypothetical protein